MVMALLTWICICIDVVAALILMAMLANPNQDAAGKGMIALPILLLLVCAAGAWLLMSRNYRTAAMVISAVPAVVTLYVLFSTLKNP